MGRGLIAVLLGVFAIALVGAGCGGGDDTGSGLTKAEFVKQGDAICAKADAKKNSDLKSAFEQQAKEGKQLNKSIERQLVTEVALPPVATMTEELADLGAPDEKAGAIVTAYEDGVSAIEDDPGSVLNGSNPFEEPDKLALEYGFKRCSEI